MSKGLPTKKPWNQWPDETDTAYDRFMAYLQMGADRSFEKVQRKYSKSTSYKRQLAKWSKKYDWVDRCKAYDEHLALQHVENQEFIQKKARSKILSRLDEAVDKLYEIALGSDHDRMQALEIIFQHAGMMGQEEALEQSSQPTYQQIINHFTNHDS